MHNLFSDKDLVRNVILWPFTLHDEVAVAAESSCNQPNPLLSDALLVPVVGLFCYFLTFTYEAAYFKQMGVPLTLVRIDLDMALVVATILGGSAFLIFWLANILSMLWPEHDGVRIKLERMLIMLSLLLWPPLVHGFRFTDYTLTLAVLLIFIFLEIALPVFRFREIPKIADRLLRDEISEAPMQRRTIFGRIYTSAGPLAYGVFFGAFLAIQVAYFTGTAEAQRTKDFYFIEEDSSWLVVRAYSDRLIAVEYDPETHAAKSSIRLLPLTSSVHLIRKTIGPLDFRSR